MLLAIRVNEIEKKKRSRIAYEKFSNKKGKLTIYPYLKRRTFRRQRRKSYDIAEENRYLVEFFWHNGFSMNQITRHGSVSTT